MRTRRLGAMRIVRGRARERQLAHWQARREELFHHSLKRRHIARDVVGGVLLRGGLLGGGFPLRCLHHRHAQVDERQDGELVLRLDACERHQLSALLGLDALLRDHVDHEQPHLVHLGEGHWQVSHRQKSLQLGEGGAEGLLRGVLSRRHVLLECGDALKRSLVVLAHQLRRDVDVQRVPRRLLLELGHPLDAFTHRLEVLLAASFVQVGGRLVRLEKLLVLCVEDGRQVGDVHVP
mmetsp:Transcript_42387/g.102799  ORF Transcript_42387/g.102799 Transcript_42387/m.102799 type:complete len:236 (+) Transcript_42387:833-1540(+)